MTYKFNLILLVLFSLLIVWWQSVFFLNPSTIPNNYKISGTVGGGGHHLEGFRKFTASFKETGLYPLNGLAMEIHDTYRMGDRGKMYLLWFDSLFSQGNWTYNRANGLFFIVALLIFFVSFWLQGYPFFAILATLFIGSCSFQLYETYDNSNIFCWPINALVLVMGLNAFAITGRLQTLKMKYYVIAMITGIALGFIRQIRPEPIVIAVSVIASYSFMEHISFKSKSLLVLLFCFGLFATIFASNHYLDYLFKKTEAYVVQKGGTPYSGYKRSAHLLWHPIFCGLGDHASALGYRWDDYSAYAYALKELRKKEPDLWPSFKEGLVTKKLSDYFIDDTGPYKRKLEDRDDYEPILRKKILSDFSSHPLVFAKLYLKRFLGAFTHTVGVQLHVPYLLKLDLNAKGFGFIFFVALWLTLKSRDYFLLKVLLFSFPLLTTSLLIHSGLGLQYYSIYPIFSFLIIIVYGMMGLRQLLGHREPNLV